MDSNGFEYYQTHLQSYSYPSLLLEAKTQRIVNNSKPLKSMDILLGSIDVRDLLSTSTIDESYPLSAPDLRLLIDRLNIKSLSIKSKVKSYIISHRHDFAGGFSSASACATSAEDLAVCLDSALKFLDSSVDREICGLAREICEKRREAEGKREALNVVEVVSRFAERLGVVRGELRDERLKDAAVSLKELMVGLRVGEVKEEDEPAVFGFLRDEWTDCFDDLQGILAKNVEKAVLFEVDNARVIVKLNPKIGSTNGAGLHITLEAMEIVGVQEYGLVKVADLMIKHVINPAISNASVNILIEEPDECSIDEREAILKFIPLSQYQDCLDGPIIYARLIEVIKFIYKYICFENRAWIQCFGRLTWPRMSDRIIKNFLSKAVPDDASKMVNFQNVIKYATEFETSLKELNFISTADSKEETLSHFTCNVEVHFASKRRLEILAKARSILLQFDHFSTEKPLDASSKISGLAKGLSINVVELLFHYERCSVSKAVSQLMELVHATLKDACLSSTLVAKEFYHAARDTLLLYRAIVPMQLEKQLDSVSQLAIIIYNDCCYLSQEILGLAFEYRADFPSGLKKLVVFADIAPNFYQMAEHILQKQIHLVDDSLIEAMNGADGFQNTHQPQEFESAKFSLEQVVFILEKVHIIWEPLMPASVYKNTMYRILDSVFSRIIKDILLLDDMAAEETLQLQRLIHMTLENLSPLFESLVADANEKDDFMKSVLDRLNNKIPSLSKFRKLADLLDMPLKSITATWESGELLGCSFTVSEVENFIKAIFTDSPLRKECLRRIESRYS